MKSIDFLFVGVPKNKGYQTLERLYLERVGHYVQSNCIYLKDAHDGPVLQRKKIETGIIFGKIKSSDCVIVCDEAGKSLGTINLSKKLLGWQSQYQRVVFVVGGAYGLARDTMIFNRANFVLKLSDFTLPHELARVVLVEQVYRALTILKGEKYHH